MSHPDAKTNYYIEAAQDLADRGFIRGEAGMVTEVARVIQQFHEKGMEYGRVIGRLETMPVDPIRGMPEEAVSQGSKKDGS